MNKQKLLSLVVLIALVVVAAGCAVPAPTPDTAAIDAANAKAATAQAKLEYKLSMICQSCQDYYLSDEL